MVAGRGPSHTCSWVTGQGSPSRLSDSGGGPGVSTERTSVKLDMRARSVAAAVVDGITEEPLGAKLTPSREHIRSWVQALPGPVEVTYQAGRAGYDRYQALMRRGSGVTSRHRAICRSRRVSGSRPTPRAPCAWPSRCGWTRSPRWGFRAWTRKPRGISCHPRPVHTRTSPAWRGRANRGPNDNDRNARRSRGRPQSLKRRSRSRCRLHHVCNLPDRLRGPLTLSQLCRRSAVSPAGRSNLAAFWAECRRRSGLGE